MRVVAYASAVLLLALAQPVEGQYRRRSQELPPIYGVTLSVGALFPYEETMNPVRAPEPDQDMRGLRDVETSPWVVLSARYGRGLGVYASASGAMGGDAELSGFDPITGEPLTGTADTGTLAILSAGVSFAPLRVARGLRIEAGPAWMDLGTGGAYLAARLAAAATFLSIGENGGVFIAWDGYLAGGQYDRDEIEYQVRHGYLTGLRAGFEYAW
ncbi:MAG TPA: hypothetical protein VF039_10405 [Longimicrobiales bacterium]